MRMKDAIASLQLGRKKQAPVRRLCTVWSEQAENGPDAVPLAEYPRPQFRRAEWQCLNGWWEYSFRQAGGLTRNRIANSIGEQPAAAAEGKNHHDEQPAAAAEGSLRQRQRERITSTNSLQERQRESPQSMNSLWERQRERFWFLFLRRRFVPVWDELFCRDRNSGTEERLKICGFRKEKGFSCISAGWMSDAWSGGTASESAFTETDIWLFLLT